MSIDATRWAWMQTGIKSIDKLLLLYLADRVGVDGTCSPGILTMARDTCLGKQTVINAARRLRDGGLIEIKRRGGQNTLYTLLIKTIPAHRNKIQSVQAKKSPVAGRL